MGCTPCTKFEKKIQINLLPASISLPQKNTETFKINSNQFVHLCQGRVQDHYKIGKKIGSGAHSFVREAVHKISLQRRAIKTINKGSISSDMTQKFKFFSEVDILSRLDHPNIVKLYEFFEDDSYFHLVTEYIGGGELFDYIIKTKHFSEYVAAHFMKQILSGVAFCHANKIVHRDIRPENLLLDKESSDAILKIVDFGTSGNISAKMTQRYGNAYYIAPEVLKKDYNEKCDIWSCGVILYILLSGQPPFSGRVDEEIIAKVEKGEYSLRGPTWEALSISSKNFLRNLLEFNPKNRISAEEALEDEWVLRYTRTAPIDISSLSINNLVSFRSEQKLQKAILTFISAQFLTKDESSKLAASFRMLDTNNDGKLSRSELLQAFTEIYGQDLAGEEVEKVFQEADTNHSGFIDYSEYILLMTKKENLLSAEVLDKTFAVFDSDKSGKISVAELKHFLGSAIQTEKLEWEDLIKEFDNNEDGEIDLSEFKTMMLRLNNYT